tara:strand:- start:125 stop:475 length:351 start_codon:yes stop_codon:yes gene_type:complete
MEEIIEKKTVKGKANGTDVTVKEKLVLRRSNFRFLLAIIILSIYGFTIYSLMYSEINMDDKVSTLLVSVISALTVLISQTGSFYFSDSNADSNDTTEEVLNDDSTTTIGGNKEPSY